MKKVEFVMKCPECGEEMEEGFLWIKWGMYRAENWWSFKKPAWHRFWRIPQVHPTLGSIMIMENTKEDYVKKGFRCPQCLIIIFNYGEMMEEETVKEEEKISPEVMNLYERLLDIYEGDRELLEVKIKKIMYWGWSREIAIQRLAGKEGLLKEE
ncbi:MAG: PF20097 family protein [Candidatus Bathyarchaeia archaeon]